MTVGARRRADLGWLSSSEPTSRLQPRVRAAPTMVSLASDPRPHVAVERIAPWSQGMTAADADMVANGAAQALKVGVPLVCSLAFSGFDVASGIDAPDSWGRAARALTACSGVVPTVVVVNGPATAAAALLLGLFDVVIVTMGACSYVCAPTTTAQYTGEELTAAELGGVGVHAHITGLASLVATDTVEAVALAHGLLAYLPASAGERPPLLETDDPLDRLVPELREVVPTSPALGYDVRDVVAAVVDNGELFELRSQWATNVVTALATVAGHPVGVVANQPQSLAGTLDIPASQKAARFVGFCDAFGIPLLTLVDTPGYLPGVELEWNGIIRHGAELAFAYANATVPRVAVITRKAYGGAYIVMDSKGLGNDVSFAWPTAEIAVMGAKGAVSILYRGLSRDAKAEREELYKRTFATPYMAAERGYIDAVIDPALTRVAVVDALRTLLEKDAVSTNRRHDNTPL